MVGASPVLTYNEPGIAAAFWSVPSPSRLVFVFGFVFGFVKSFLFGSLRGTEIGTIMHVKKRQTPNHDVCEGKARQGRRVGHFTHEPSAVTHVIVRAFDSCPKAVPCVRLAWVATKLVFGGGCDANSSTF